MFTWSFQTMDNEIIKMFTKYNAWTNQLIFKAVAELPAKEITKKHPNMFGSIIQILNHNYIIGLIWKATLEKREHNFTNLNPKQEPRLEDLHVMQQTLSNWYINYYNTMSFEQLTTPIHYKLIDGTTGTMTPEEILLHIVNHSTYHRGFIAEIFYTIPAKPPSTDLTVFLKEEINP